MLQLDEFVDHAARSGLIPIEDLDRARADLDPGPGPDAALRLARKLVQEGRLTSYQAKKLLAGATRGFFLGGYRILQPLGEGGMGKVFLAVHEQSLAKVAIKVLPPRRAVEEVGSLVRFRREMELSQRCVHPNVARTIAVGNDGDVYFMVLEYIPGMSLYDMVRHPRYGPLRVSDACRLFLKVLDGLDAAHRAGLVHRDIKPSNIMVTPDGNAKILDLGLARALGEEGGITRANTVLGTLDYASPEQLSDATKADVRSDLYSVGCTLYFALSARPPFEGGDMINKIFRQRLEDPEPLEKLARGVPAAFAAIVRKLMAKKPEERYQSCGELRADLARWTDPARLRAVLGAEAEAARSFRPPPPPLAEDDLRLLSIADDESPSVLSLRDLGDPEPSPAPRHRAPLPPLPAAVRHRAEADPRDPPPAADSRWLLQFSLVVLGIGIVAVLVIALLLHG
ncbi:MAG: serine/threonine-protein kinase [Isosphaeraceae bacterium]